MMTQTPEQYAEMVIAKFYKVENIYNLTKAIARVADKYAKWLMEASDRMTWAIVGDDEHDKSVELSQQEAWIKCQAYRLALLTLTDKLRK
jgi:hypothetical protein